MRQYLLQVTHRGFNLLDIATEEISYPEPVSVPLEKIIIALTQFGPAAPK